MWGFGDYRIGIWLFGLAAMIWVADCFAGFYLTLPVRKGTQELRSISARAERPKEFWRRWRRAWKNKASGSVFRINFDIHRALGLWFWIVFLTLAFTSISLNLGNEVMRPIVSLFSPVSPHRLENREEVAKMVVAKVSRSEALALGRIEAQRRGWSEPVIVLRYYDRLGVYRLSFSPPDRNGSFGLIKTLYLDAQDGRQFGEFVPWQGSAGDVFLEAQFPLHSGRIAGLPGRIFISFFGFVCAALSVTGVLIWRRKRRARTSIRRRNAKAASLG